MLINTKQLCTYLRTNAETLRKGGSEASAVIYDEIAAGIEEQEKDLEEEQEAELAEAWLKATQVIPIEKAKAIESLGLIIVPADWRRAG